MQVESKIANITIEQLKELIKNKDNIIQIFEMEGIHFN
jgi:hypothetical protein